jgi:hypothetical protein
MGRVAGHHAQLVRDEQNRRLLLGSPQYSNNAVFVNSISVLDKDNVWASPASPLGVFNYFRGANSWQHNCPVEGCLTTNSQLMVASVGLASDGVSPDIWTVNSAGTIYRVNTLLVNNNNPGSDLKSLFNVPAPVTFTQVIASRQSPLAVTSTGHVFQFQTPY